MKVPEDWWKDYFNEIYLITDARSVCNTSLTRREVSLLEKLLSLDKNEPILDLCGGQGRHSLELAKRGYENLTVLDSSGYLVNLGKKRARQQNYKIRFLRRDARTTRLKSAAYSNIFILANSFGYFPKENQNLKILKETHRILKKRGKLLLDLTDSRHVKKNLKPVSWHKACKDISVLRKRTLVGNVVNAREIVISQKKGIIRDGLYCERLYTKNAAYGLLKKAGFGKVLFQGGISLYRNKKDYGLMSKRMFITAIKA
ncbi:methyltransferase domain-containing protein [Candidatus Omnitrophota bacterium]